MGMLQKYQNKLRSERRKRKRKQIEDGEVETIKIKVVVPMVAKGAVGKKK